MPNRRRHLKVFLCHDSSDKPRVRALYKRLVADGVDAWLDEEKLLPGQDWHVEISKAVRVADVVAICLSNQSITKEGYVQREMKFALDVAEEKPESSIFIIPARLEECEVPERMKRWQWVDLFNEGGYEKLMKALQLRAKITKTSVIRSKENTRPKKTSVSIHPDAKGTESSTELEKAVLEKESHELNSPDRVLRPTNNRGISPAQPRQETIQPIDELKKPVVPFLIRLIFTLVALGILVYVIQTYLNNQRLLTCTPPTVSAAGVSITLWLLLSLAWCYLEEPVTNLVNTVPPGQQDFKVLLAKIIIRLTDLFLLGQLSKTILFLIMTVSVIGTLILWGLNQNGILYFSSSEETPQIVGFSFNSANGTQTLSRDGMIELRRSQQYLVKANPLPNNVICNWSSGLRGTLPIEPSCATRYTVPLTAGEMDTLTVQIQSACKTKSIFASLNVKILKP